MHARTHAYTHACTRAHTHAFTHARAHALTQDLNDLGDLGGSDDSLYLPSPQRSHQPKEATPSKSAWAPDLLISLHVLVMKLFIISFLN